MEEFNIGSFIVIFEEMFGAFFFWFLVLAAVAVVLFFVYIKISNESLKTKQYQWWKFALPLGAIIPVLFVQWISGSNFADIGGPIDVIVIVLIATGGAVGAAVLAYLVQQVVEGTQKEQVA